MINLLFLVDKAKARSGPHRNVVSSLNSLSNRDDIYLYLLTDEIDQNALYYNANNIKIIRGFNPHKLSKVFSNIKKIRSLIKFCSINIIYVPTGLKSFLYAYFCKNKKTKLVAGPNVTGIPFLMDIYNPSPLMTTKMADVWIEMSELRIKSCIQAGTKRDKIKLVPHAIDTKLFHPDKKDNNIWQQFNIPQNSIKIIHVGRFNEQRKETDLLIKIFINFLKYYSNVYLFIIGKKGKFLPCEVFNHSNIKYLGPKYDIELATFYASSDFFLGTSSNETFWFCPLEAMSSGIPIVVTNTGATSLMITEDGKEGFFLPIFQENNKIKKENYLEISEKILQNISENKKYISMGYNARNRVEEYFNESRLGQDLISLFKEKYAK